MLSFMTSYSCTILCYWANETPPRRSLLCNKCATSSSRVQNVAAFSIGRTTCRNILSFKQFATSRMLLSAGHRGRLYRSFVPNSTRYPCANCTSVFGQKRSLLTHLRYECGQPPRFKCPYCDLISKKTSNIQKHIRRKHEGNAVYVQDIYLLPNLTV